MSHIEHRRRAVPLPWTALVLAFAACAAPARDRAELVADYPVPSADDAVRRGAESYRRAPQQEPWHEPWRREKGLSWAPGQPLMQGLIGFTSFENVTADIGGSTVDGDEGDADILPLLGGGGQWKLGGSRIDWGIEGMLSMAGNADVVAFASGGGGAVVAIDVDLLLIDLYGGMFASMFMTDKLRLYCAAGPLMQWADWEQTGDLVDEGGSGFGAGYYARTGFEFVLPSHTMVGFGVRWSDSSVDLDNNLGDLEIRGLEVLFTISTGLEQEDSGLPRSR